jgi:hypothetical protein
MFFTQTSLILLSSIYILWPKTNSSIGENISFWKVKCYEVLESMNQISSSIIGIDKSITKNCNLVYYSYMLKIFNLVLSILFYLVTFFYEMTFNVTTIASSIILDFFILKFSQIYIHFELPKNILIIGLFCLFYDMVKYIFLRPQLFLQQLSTC